MASKPKFTVQDIRAGAIYRLGAKRGLDRSTLVALLTDRAGFSAKTAKLLAGHWLTTEPFRRPAA